MPGGQLVLAFDAGCVAGAFLTRAFGRPRVRAWARFGLPPGALVPSGFDPNLTRPDEVRGALERLRAELGRARSPACVLLPAGVARTALLELPPRVQPAEYARYRLGPTLPYPAEEAVIDGLTLAGGLFLAGAARRAVVAEYEAAAAAAGFRQRRLDLAPLAGLSGLLRRHDRGPGIDVVLGDVATILAARRGSSLTAVRSRRRSGEAQEWDRLAEAVDRLSHEDAGGGRLPVRVVGPGSPPAAETLRRRGYEVVAGWPEIQAPPEADQAPWLGGVL